MNDALSAFLAFGLTFGGLAGYWAYIRARTARAEKHLERLDNARKGGPS